MNHTSKQLREKIEDILQKVHDDALFMGTGSMGYSERAVDKILDSQREEYKGIIEGLRMEKKIIKGKLVYPDNGGIMPATIGASEFIEISIHNEAVDEFNSKIDELLKKL